MKIKIDEDVAQEVQNLTTINLREDDYYYFTDWLLRVGIATVKSALERHPELTLGDLVMLQYQSRDYH